MKAYARFVALLHHLRLSPLMAGALAALGLLDVVGVITMGLAFFPSAKAPQEIRADWRPPRLAANNSSTPQPSISDNETLTRPLFSKTRKPFVVNDKKQQSSALDLALVAPPAGLTLSALTIFRNERRAFLTSAAAPKGKWCAIGDEFDGWTVTQMQHLEITMQSGDKTVQLKLYPEPQK